MCVYFFNFLKNHHRTIDHKRVLFGVFVLYVVSPGSPSISIMFLLAHRSDLVCV